MQFEDFAGELDSPGAGAYALFTGDLDPVGVDVGVGVNAGGGRGVVNPPMAADLPRRAAAMPLPAGYLLFNGELDRAPDERVNAGAGRGTADDPRSLLRKQAPVPQKSRPTSPSSVPERSWGEALSDTSKSLAQGLLDVGSLPGVAYSAVTGDYDTAYLNAIRGTQEVLQDGKSPAMQAHAQALQKKLSTAEGWREKLAVAGWETLTDPALLGDAVARSGPGMLAGGLFGRAAGSAVDAAGNAMLGRTIATGSEAAARSAVALKNAAPVVASGSAVGVSAAQQGASVANELYAELQKLPTSAFAAEPEFQQLAREHGEDKARSILAAAAANRALLVGTGASVLSMKLVPGGDAIEKMFLPSHLKGTAREAVKSTSFMTRPLTRGMEGSLGSQALEVLVQRARSAGTESFSEGAEEASGAVAKGLELSRAGQDVKLDEMAGEAAGQGMAVGGIMGGTAGAHGAGAAPRVPQQPTRPTVPPVPPTAREQRGSEPHTAGGPASPPPPSPPSPSADLSAAPIEHSYAYSGGMLPGSGATWSEVAAADRKAQAEAEILRQAEALLAQEVATSTTATPSPAVPSATPEMPLPAPTDGNSSSSTQQGANALPQGQVNSDADQAATATQASATDPAANALGTPAPAPTPSTLNTEADASAAATDIAPATTQHGSAHHTAASQVQAPAPIEAQVQALNSGMLVVGGDQATTLAHLQAGGVRGAEPFAGVTLVPVDQAALAQQVLSRPLAAPAGPVGPQADSGSQHASATTALPRARTAAQLAPTATQAPTAGSSIGGPSPLGASAPRTEGRHGSPTSAAASQPVPVMEMQRDGTLMIKGDPVQLQERLRQGGVDRVLRREGGVLVGLDQVHKARQLLQQQPPRAQASADPSLPSQSSLSGQQFSRSAPHPPDRPSRARGLPSKPATVQSVRAAVARLTNSMGLLAEGRGRVVVATSADIQAHWEPLVGEVDMGSQDTGLAQGFFDPNSKTVLLIADHIEAGQEMAVAAHELVHKHGKAVLGEAGWKQLHEVIGTWANRPAGSLERRVHDEAAARVQASRPAGADETSYSSEELFPYAVQVAMELGVQPTALMPNNSVQGWLARVRAALRSVFEKLTGQPGLFDSQDLVNLAWGIAQRENPEHVRELDAIWTEVPGDVQAVIDSARQPGHAPQKAVLGGVPEWLAYEAALQAGLNIAGFTHVIDGSAARHMLNRHTNPAIEKSRGQIALSDADILAAPQVINDPDLVVLGTKTQGQKDQIVYLKRLEDGSILYLEEVRTGRREMAAMSMRKYPAAKDFSAILATLPSNAQSDGGNTKQIVLVPPPTGKLAEPGGPMFSRQTGVDTPKITKSGPKPDDSILVDGSPDMWTVPAQVEKATKGMFPSAPVRLKNGFHRRTNQGYGVAHIEAEHAVEISALGLTVPQYVQRILGGATKVYDPGNGRLYIVNERFAGKHQAIIELRDDGDHYSVVTAFARRPEGKVVWSGRSSSAGLPSANAPLATGKTESFDSTPAFGSSADPSAYRDNGEPQIETPKPSPSSRIAGQTDEILPEGG